MKRLIVVVLALASCKYPALPELSSDATNGPDGSQLGGSDGGITVAPPTGLTYSDNPATYYVGSAITPNAPSSSGGAIASYAVSPPLPDGLELDTSTGVINGTPTAPATATAYMVTARNASGNTTADLVIGVVLVEPMNLAYSANPVMYTAGIAITPNTPSSTGGPIAGCSVLPTLPAGLSIDPSTGVISGTPTSETAATSYTVTATNLSGSATASVVINVEMTGFVATGYKHSCAIVGSAAKCWGDNDDGDVGSGSYSGIVTTPAQVLGLTSGVQAITGGYECTCAIVNGGAQCWGALGNDAPAPVSGLTSGVQAITAGDSFACAVVTGGAQCWGDNSYGELGNNSGSSSTTPVQVAGLTSEVHAIAAGYFHACAVVGGGVQCWGENNDGQLGNNSMTNSSVPVQVSGLTAGVQAISAGQEHTCALVNNGVECWGDNSLGQLGNGSSASSLVPVQVSGLTSGVEAIGGGFASTCALLNTGAIKCWGYNGDGELGNNSQTNSNIPVQVSGVTSGAQAIGGLGNGDHTCALILGHVKCWGFAGDGQLGNGATTGNYLTPVQVTGL